MNLPGQYIELLKKTLINEIYIENEVKLYYLVQSLAQQTAVNWQLLINPEESLAQLLRGLEDCKAIGSTAGILAPDSNGDLKPAPIFRNVLEIPHSMIGRKRMDNLQFCIETVLKDGIPGDFIETGVWRGGATIFMRGMLAAHSIGDRTVWVADSFEGLPPATWEQDEGIDLTKNVLPVLAVSLERVKQLFERYDLLDEQVKFLKGWFKDTLPDAPIEQLSILRLDGDLYESTMDGLNALYDKVSPGGFVIVDDYYALEVCKQAVQDFRQDKDITEEIIDIDPIAVYWRKRA